MDNQCLLLEMHKGAKMASEAIDAVKRYVEDRPLQNLLSQHKKEYCSLSADLENELRNEGYEAKSLNAAEKARLWGGVFFQTLTDSSASKIAEIMIQGFNMGVITLTRELNKTPDQEKLHAERLLNLYRSNIETYKSYL